MRALAGSALALLFLAGCWSQDRFQISGTITTLPRLHKRMVNPNTMLFVVASNSAGVPVAVKRIINPRFPLAYRMEPEDVVLPGPVWQGPLGVEVQVNTHGQVGVVKSGDLIGRHRGPARVGDRHVDIVIDSAAR